MIPRYCRIPRQKPPASETNQETQKCLRRKTPSKKPKTLLPTPVLPTPVRNPRTRKVRYSNRTSPMTSSLATRLPCSSFPPHIKQNRLCTRSTSVPDQRLFLDFAHLNYNAAHVETTLRAHAVGWNHCAALAAYLQLLGLLVVVSSSLASPGIRMSTLWYCHVASMPRKRPKNSRPMCQFPSPDFPGLDLLSGANTVSARRKSVKAQP